MKYLLLISLIFKKYKGSTDVSLYSDDLFIDQFTLQDDTTTMSTARKDERDQFRHIYRKILGQNKFRALPKLTKVYEIDETSIGREFSIRINDSNTNYTNGFMTKSNTLQLFNCILVPKKLLTTSKWARCVRMFEKHNSYISRYKKEPDFQGVETYSRHMYWPGTDFHIVNGKLTQRHWVGGKSVITLPVIKKFQMHILWPGRGKIERPRFRYHWRSLFLIHNLQLLNT